MILADVRTIMWKEWKALVEQIGGDSLLLPVVILVFFLAIGSFSAYTLGATWLRSPLVLLLYPFLAASIAIQPVTDSFAGERERHTLETLLASRLTDAGIVAGKMLAAFVPAVLLGLVMFGLGILTVNVFHTEHWRIPETWLLVGTCGLTITLSGFVTCGGVFVSMAASSVRQATQIFGFVLVGAILIPAVGAFMLPDSVRADLAAWLRATTPLTLVLIASGALLLLDLGFLAASFRRFRRNRIVLV